MVTRKTHSRRSPVWLLTAALLLCGGTSPASAQESFDALVKRTQQEKPTFAISSGL